MLNEGISEEIDCRYQDILTPNHRLAYLLDHRHFLRKKREDGAQEETEVESSTTKSSHPRPQMSNEEEEIAQQFIFDNYESLIPASAAYETKDTQVIPRMAFSPSLVNTKQTKY